MRGALLLAVALGIWSALPCPGTVASAQPATPEQLAVLDEILARPEFRVAEGRGVLDALLDPVRAVVRAVLREATRAFGRLAPVGGEGTAYLGLAVALLITAGAGAVVARLARGTLATEAELAEAVRVGPPRAEAELARAAALAAAGDLRGAVHHRYLAALRRLDDRGLLRFDRSLTNRELLPRTVASPVVADALAPLVAAFDRLWYGQPSCSPEEYARFVALADRVWDGTSDGGDGSDE